jgi:hypothetical protein
MGAVRRPPEWAAKYTANYATDYGAGRPGNHKACAGPKCRTNDVRS